jgi:hypothetical protein
MAKTTEEIFNISTHKKMQVKITLRFHLIPTRMAIIKNINDNKY